MIPESMRPWVRNPKLQIAILLMGLGLILPKPTLACGEACATDADCSSSNCAYCSEFGLCADCCEIPDALSCADASACTWTSGECRNNPTYSCLLALPDVPKQSRTWIFLFALPFIGLILFLKRKWQRQ